MNVLITGGYGFIGSHVAEEFHKEGYSVFIIDNLSTGNPDNIKFKHNFFHLDIEDRRCKEIFKSNKFDVVINLAAQINVTSSIENPYRDTMSNILGLTNMLQLSAEYGVKKFVFASSAAVYGNNEEIPLREDAVLDPLSPYGMSKSTGEFYCNKWSELYGLSVLCFRFSNVYGPRQGMLGEGGVVSIFIERAAQGKELSVFGSGNQTRDFIYVKDVANAVYKSVKDNISGIFNLSTGSESSVNELIETLDSLQPLRGVCYMDKREGDIENSCLDNTKLKQAIDWKPRYALSEGLKNTYAWHLDYQRKISKDDIARNSSITRTPFWKHMPILSLKPGLLFCIENLLLFIITCFMTIISQSSLYYYVLDYKLIYILLTGMMYGTKQAILSAALSCGLYIYLYIESGRDMISLVYDTNSLLQLSFYIFISIVIGYTVDTKNKQLEDKDSELKSLNERLLFMNEIHDNTLKINDELCEQIIGAQDSYGKVYSILSKLNSLNPDKVIANGIGVLETMMKSDKVSIYVISDKEYTAILAAKSDIKDFFVPRTVSIREREDINKVIETKDIYINNEWLPTLPVMTAPITNRGNIIGVACIHWVAFENLTLYRQNLLRTTANLISYALTNAYKYSEKSQSSYLSYFAATYDGSYQAKEN